MSHHHAFRTGTAHVRIHSQENTARPEHDPTQPKESRCPESPSLHVTKRWLALLCGMVKAMADCIFGQYVTCVYLLSKGLSLKIFEHIYVRIKRRRCNRDPKKGALRQ